MTARRHSWSLPSRPSEMRTVRTCSSCGLRKVTRHDGGPAAIPWTEFYRFEQQEPTRGPIDRCEPEWVLLEAGRCLGERGGGSWSRPSRPRIDVNPMQGKLLFERQVSA